MSDGQNDPDVIISEHDTPTERVAINQLSVDELDAWLEVIRTRRLATVQKLEAIAKVRADEARLETFLKFQRAYDRAKKAVKKLDEQLDKTEVVVHKARLLAMAMEMEVSEDADC